MRQKSGKDFFAQQGKFLMPQRIIIFFLIFAHFLSMCSIATNSGVIFPKSFFPKHEISCNGFLGIDEILKEKGISIAGETFKIRMESKTFLRYATNETEAKIFARDFISEKWEEYERMSRLTNNPAVEKYKPEISSEAEIVSTYLFTTMDNAILVPNKPTLKYAVTICGRTFVNAHDAMIFLDNIKKSYIKYKVVKHIVSPIHSQKEVYDLKDKEFGRDLRSFDITPEDSIKETFVVKIENRAYHLLSGISYFILENDGRGGKIKQGPYTTHYCYIPKTPKDSYKKWKKRNIFANPGRSSGDFNPKIFYLVEEFANRKGSPPLEFILNDYDEQS